MSKKIRINYTSNENKAAKVYLIEEFGISKNEFLGYAILPDDIHKYNEQTLNFVLKKGEIYCKLNNGKELAIIEGNDVKNGYKNSITALFDLKKLKENIDVTFDKSWFILGLPQVKKTKDFKYSNLNIVENNLKTPIANNKIDEARKIIAPQKIKNSQTKKHQYLNEQNQYNSLDVFDVMYMNAFPELAPFYKPNSFLAWYLYFNNTENQELILNNPEILKSVPGFENARDFYINKNDGLLNIEYINSNGKNITISYFLNHMTICGDTETFDLSCQGNNYKLTGQSITGATLDSDIKVENGHLQYDYSIAPNNVPEMTGNFLTQSILSNTNDFNNLNSSLDTQSNGNRDFFVDPIKNVVIPISETKFEPLGLQHIEPEINKEYKYDLNLEKRYEPPPPPPPPPEYGSNDPYSYSSSSFSP